MKQQIIVGTWQYDGSVYEPVRGRHVGPMVRLYAPSEEHEDWRIGPGTEQFPLEGLEQGQVVAVHELPAAEHQPAHHMRAVVVVGDGDGDPMEMAAEAYYVATGGWTGADWTHELVRGGRVVTEIIGGYTAYEAPEEAVYCEETDDCEVCADAASDARACEQYALDALAAAGRGDWETAAELARDCATIESEWGDCPTWGPFRDAVVAAAAQVEAAESQGIEDLYGDPARGFAGGYVRAPEAAE